MLRLAEHLRLPDIQDVHEGVISARIAGHAADIVKGIRVLRNVITKCLSGVN
jgi:thiamine biosynthesis protein ThiC